MGNTLRLFCDIYPPYCHERWEVYAFEGSPLLRNHMEQMSAWLNGEMPKPNLSLPTSPQILLRHASKCGCGHYRKTMRVNCMLNTQRVKSLSSQLMREYHEEHDYALVNCRLDKASHPPQTLRFTFVPAIISSKQEWKKMSGLTPENIIKGNSAVSSYRDRIDINAYVPGVDVVSWMEKYFSEDCSIFMKMDIEGSEHDVIPQLLMSSVIKNVKLIALECHGESIKCYRILAMLRKSNVRILLEGRDYNNTDSYVERNFPFTCES